MSSQHSNAKIVFGAMSIGKAGLPGCRQTTPEEVGAVLDKFQEYGYNEIDTSRAYARGTSEALLGQSSWHRRGLKIQTKIYPSKNATSESYSLGAADLRRALTASLDALQTEKIDLWYLHAPDRDTPLEETLCEVDKLYREGKFERFGISNFMAWEVAKICEICDRNGWILPTVYQGIYNPVHRAIESELLPCLRHYGISLYAFQPLAGGLLTGRYQYETTSFDSGSRYDPKNMLSSSMNARYWNVPTFEALSIIKTAAQKYDLTLPECSYRWLIHHSQLSGAHGDALILGASNLLQLESNLSDVKKARLPDDVAKAFEDAWQHIQEPVRKYWH